MRYYVLNKGISGEKILSDINSLVQKFQQSSPDKTPVLVIDIKSISYDDTSMIPKLEHKDTE